LPPVRSSSSASGHLQTIDARAHSFELDAIAQTRAKAARRAKRRTSMLATVVVLTVMIACATWVVAARRARPATRARQRTRGRRAFDRTHRAAASALRTETTSMTTIEHGGATRRSLADHCWHGQHRAVEPHAWHAVEGVVVALVPQHALHGEARERSEGGAGATSCFASA
jgi:hypothetical protein